MSRIVEAKTILSTVKAKPDPYFGLSFNMNLYRGCQHGCIYCDSRSACYKLGNLADIRIKKDAIQILERELRSKKSRGTVGFGSMNDCYMPVDKEVELTRQALFLMDKYKFPVHIITKSNLVVRDLDVLQRISNVYAAISFTITTTDDNLARITEPSAPLPSERFAAMKELSEHGIYCGITFMPVLPFINDTEENVANMVRMAHASGAHYILPYFGLTLREGNREYLYEIFETHFPGMKEKYQQHFGNQYNCSSPNAKKLYSILSNLCQNNGISTKMKFYTPLQYNQWRLF
jgi:DNA repair photolyase